MTIRSVIYFNNDNTCRMDKLIKSHSINIKMFQTIVLYNITEI